MEATASLYPRHLPWQHTRQLRRWLAGTQNGLHLQFGSLVTAGGREAQGVSGHWARRRRNAQVLSTQVSGSGDLTGHSANWDQRGQLPRLTS